MVELISVIMNRVKDFHNGLSDVRFYTVRWVFYSIQHERNANEAIACVGSGVRGF